MKNHFFVEMPIYGAFQDIAYWRSKADDDTCYSIYLDEVSKMAASLELFELSIIEARKRINSYTRMINKATKEDPGSEFTQRLFMHEKMQLDKINILSRFKYFHATCNL